jgi:hypothetical protein
MFLGQEMCCRSFVMIALTTALDASRAHDGLIRFELLHQRGNYREGRKETRDCRRSTIQRIEAERSCNSNCVRLEVLPRRRASGGNSRGSRGRSALRSHIVSTGSSSSSRTAKATALRRRDRSERSETVREKGICPQKKSNRIFREPWVVDNSSTGRVTKPIQKLRCPTLFRRISVLQTRVSCDAS